MESNLFDVHSDNNYPKLNADSAQIRLIVLERGELNSPIHCTYRVVDLDDKNLSYETVSYVWKDGTGTQPVWVDGQAATVTQSLFGALEQLRYVDRERTLWADAICINQSDKSEKTHQVGKMCRIYSQCRQCNIWMGSLSDTSLEDASLALDTVAWVAGDVPDRPASLDDLSRRERAAEALTSLLSKPWWSRMWTLQEVILPSQSFIYWGPCKVLPWKSLERAAEAVMDDGPIKPPADLQEYEDEFYASGAFNHLSSGLRGLRFSLDEQPLYLFWRWRFRHATEPHDKIYALMGFRSDVSLPSVPKCDYEIDATTLFTRVTADLINICTDLNPLIGRRGEASAIAGLPSWVVDWSGPRPGEGRSEFWMHQARWTNRDYCADRGIFGVGDGLRFAEGSKQRTLLLAGLYVDKIAVVEQRQSGSHGNAESFHEDLLDGADRWGDLITRFQRSAAATGHAVELPDGWMRALLGLIMGRLVPGDPDDDDTDDWHGEMFRNQALFITEGGKFGLGPLNTHPGQQLWVVGGCRLPVILDQWPRAVTRKVGDEASCRDFTWVGDCFVYGMMKGEAVDGREHEQIDFRLH